ncbi:hypothetical protein G6F57_008953 [Rhizopus arrhizus]|uniref:Uncharacterized protein n=1 Tax=Rhizopus oryzae TaxID=64495 RepID=A0A9P7BQ83_RHIOR|nr:hypothetical protein G6F23_004306 [Rhizopus arrhizus]KAG1415927.1 hypothetical protein G6F58_006234 [Rhizopus delemar]KAG0759706.1 hypothetical protein G6F24_008878 [Rhizopus arrhizus]KAG0790454.1 hypothetical protein G6F21_005798 [Rhizopus arrhizus]KAG0799127.1 hypothetical protein G6F22_003536 [Rhizopus arrhizus]
MNYHYQSYTKTNNDETTTTVVVHEISETEASHLLLEEKSHYEILDEDRLTEHDFMSLMNSNDIESDNESDIEQRWFPSLLKNSVIQFLDDKEEEEDGDTIITDAVNEMVIEEDDDDEAYLIINNENTTEANQGSIPIDVYHFH